MSFLKIRSLLLSILVLFAIIPGLTFAADAAKSTDKKAMAAETKNKHDAEIIAFVMAIDDHEINAADEAMKHNLSAPVSDYAKMLKDHHEQNKSDMQKMADSMSVTPNESKMVMDFKATGDKKLAKLAATTPDDKFEHAYVDAMINGHKEALGKVDSFIKQANNADLKKSLTDFRKTVKDHLDQAEKLKKDMKAKK